MELNIKNISSLEKVRNTKIMNELEEINSAKVLAGENYSYQVCCTTETRVEVKVSVQSRLADYIKMYVVKDAIADRIEPHDEDIILTEPGLVPDILLPLEKQNYGMFIVKEVTSIWLDVQVPENFPAGVYPVKLVLQNMVAKDDIVEKTFDVEVLPANIPEQSTAFTQWFHVDCIANVHDVEMYSEEHWVLIEKYARLAREIGITTLLTPIITPPLDTEVGLKRRCTQLVKIEKCGEKYYFDFKLLDRWIDMGLRVGMKNFEMAHLFSQWGLKFTPNIKVWENGVEFYKFDTNVVSTDPSYKDFLGQFIPALVEYLKNKRIFDICYFHISDEPYEMHLEVYKYARDILAPMVGEDKLMDAISHVEYYQNGLTKLPVVSINRMEPFLEEDIENRWGYYCTSQWEEVSNRFLAMPLYRTRVIGLQIYKFDLVGFLHWGYNFYNSNVSKYPINPFVTTSSDKSFQSGDGFSVYPMPYGPVPSLRALVFKEALQDVEVCKKLESYIGREAVIKMIDEYAGMDVTFKVYPRNSAYIPTLISKMKEMIAEYATK